jgi:hypothetical protein
MEQQGGEDVVVLRRRKAHGASAPRGAAVGARCGGGRGRRGARLRLRHGEGGHVLGGPCCDGVRRRRRVPPRAAARPPGGAHPRCFFLEHSSARDSHEILK